MSVSEQASSVQDEASGDRSMYVHVGSTLYSGLLLSIGVMVAGLLLAALRTGSSAAHVLPLDQIIPHLLVADPSAVLDLGILLLCATPLAGVIVALVAFIRRRETGFVLVTTVLLIILIAGFAIAVR